MEVAIWIGCLCNILTQQDSPREYVAVSTSILQHTQRDRSSIPSMATEHHSTNTSSSMSDLATQICNQINSVFSQPTPTNDDALSIFVQEIEATATNKGRVFVHGVGREGLMLKALCMRLAHLGLSAHCVGDMTTPPITSSSDLLIASAGPGGFSTVDAICGIARSNGARVLVITAQSKGGSATKYATSVAVLPAQTMADDHNNNSPPSLSLLPMGSVYEGAMFVLFEMVVFKLTSILGQTPETVRSRHTNLE